MKPRLYLETTIPSYLAAKPSRDLRVAADQLTTQEWWAQRRDDFDLFVSQEVLDEVARGNPAFAATRLEFLREAALLADSSIAKNVSVRILSESIIPATAASDAMHLAMAAGMGWTSCSLGIADI